MKSIQTREVRGHSEPELKKMIAENESRITALNFQKMTGHLENSAQIKVLRRDIARIKTVLHQRSQEAAAK